MAPQDKQVIVHDGKIALKGWAYSGGGNWVERVEVSPDGYAVWTISNLSVLTRKLCCSGHVWYAVPEENLTDKVC
jgi:sulfite oxidase